MGNGIQLLSFELTDPDIKRATMMGRRGGLGRLGDVGLVLGIPFRNVFSCQVTFSRGLYIWSQRGNVNPRMNVNLVV